MSPRQSSPRSFGSTPGRSRALTVTELLMVIGLILIIASMAYPALTAARDRGRLVQCFTNMRNIMLGLQFYAQAYHTYPPQNASLPAILSSRSGTADFKCPEDEEPGNDSYSLYYVCRREHNAAKDVVIGCPRHYGYRSSANLLVDASQVREDMIPLSRKTGAGEEEVSPGDMVTEGILQVEGGSEVRVVSGTPRVIPLTAFRQPKGWLHAILRVPGADTGVVEIEALERTRIELVTHSGVILVEEASAQVALTLSTRSGVRFYTSRVTALKNATKVTPTGGAYWEELPGGFTVFKGSDSAYEPARVPEGKMARLTRED